MANLGWFLRISQARKFSHTQCRLVHDVSCACARTIVSTVKNSGQYLWTELPTYCRWTMQGLTEPSLAVTILQRRKLVHSQNPEIGTQSQDSENAQRNWRLRTSQIVRNVKGEFDLHYSALAISKETLKCFACTYGHRLTTWTTQILKYRSFAQTQLGTELCLCERPILQDMCSSGGQESTAVETAGAVTLVMWERCKSRVQLEASEVGEIQAPKSTFWHGSFVVRQPHNSDYHNGYRRKM